MRNVAKQAVLASAIIVVAWFSAVGAKVNSQPQIISLTTIGQLAWTNAVVPSVATVESTSTPNGTWAQRQNLYATASVGQASVTIGDNNEFFRVRFADVSPTSSGFTNFIHAYGLLETIAGNGAGRTDGESYWQNSFEGAPATNAALSRPHYAMADGSGDVFIVDKDSHSVLRVDTNGILHTFCGTHAAGYNGDGPMPATNMQLNFPNALWVHADGTVYVLDTDNGRVRRIATNGMATTLFYADKSGAAISGGRQLWVNADESLAYFGNKTKVRKWTPADGVTTLASGFTNLGCFCVTGDSSLIVADRGGNYVYRVTATGNKTIIAGNGSISGGGDGADALQTGFYGPRGVWPVPTGGYLLLLHDGAQLWYVDRGNTAHLLLNGEGNNLYVHAGDGEYFYNNSIAKIGEGRSVTMDAAGNIIICESDYGFVRRIRMASMKFGN